MFTLTSLLIRANSLSSIKLNCSHLRCPVVDLDTIVYIQLGRRRC